VVDVSLRQKFRVVWEKKAVAVIIESNTVVELPEVPFDRVRVTVTRWVGKGGGLAEIQVFTNDTNIALARKTTASAFLRPDYYPSRVTDGLVKKIERGVPLDCWRLPENTTGWIEVDLSTMDDGKVPRESGLNGPTMNTGKVHIRGY